MKFKKNEFTFYLIITDILLLISFSSLSMTGDIEKPIYIESDKQLINVHGNILAFSGHVSIRQGTIRINADKVIVTRPNGKQGKETIDCYADPTVFYQTQDNGKSVKGRASWVHYELDKNLLILTKNAYLEQFDSNISGDKIVYLVKERKIQACSKKGNRVTTVLIPSQFQHKNKDYPLMKKER